jgi:5-(aminomethyl)-3-furanmethanol phosphate kinase
MIHGSTPPVILKIGGSLAEGTFLRAWLNLAADHSDRSIVIVPGGGPFADQVRVAQPQLGFDDAVAHRMALLAMEQYAIAMSGMEPRLCLASSPITLERALLRRDTALWLPSAMARGRPDLPESWEVTSDSLACWLANELCARRVVLIKSATPPENLTTAAALARAGYVDAAFPRFRDQFRGEVAFMGAADHASAAGALAAGRDFGTAIQS